MTPLPTCVFPSHTSKSNGSSKPMMWCVVKKMAKAFTLSVSAAHVKRFPSGTLYVRKRYGDEGLGSTWNTTAPGAACGIGPPAGFRCATLYRISIASLNMAAKSGTRWSTKLAV